jgi:hypothetical protein
MGERYVSNIRDVRNCRGVDCDTGLLFWYTLNIGREHQMTGMEGSKKYDVEKLKDKRIMER